MREMRESERRAAGARRVKGAGSNWQGSAPNGPGTNGAVGARPVGVQPVRPYAAGVNPYTAATRSRGRKRGEHKPHSSSASAGPFRSRRRTTIAAVIALLLGMACLGYPFLSNALYHNEQDRVVQAAATAVAETPTADLDAARQAAVSYNERLLNTKSVVTDPFDASATRPTDADYEGVLNLAGDGIMATLVIPKIHVNLPIYHGTSDEALQKGVGHLQGTSVPMGGASTHAVLSGHTGLPSRKIFDALDQVAVGDYFIIQVLGEDHAYRVTSIETVLPEDTDSLTIQDGKDLVTLVTCTPYGVNTHRLLVHAERCEVPEEWLDKDKDEPYPSGYPEPSDPALLPSVLLGLLVAAVVIGVYLGIERVRAGRAERGAGVEAGASRGRSVRKGAAKTKARAYQGRHFRA